MFGIIIRISVFRFGVIGHRCEPGEFENRRGHLAVRRVDQNRKIIARRVVDGE